METIKTRVRQVFEDLTRYPADILDPEADLELDLGIDSVKRGEIFAVLAKEYGLPPITEAPPDKVWTIGVIIRAIEDHVRLNDAGKVAKSEEGRPHQNGAATLRVQQPTPLPAPTSVPVVTDKSSSAAAKNGNGVDHHDYRDRFVQAVRELDPASLRNLLTIIEEALPKTAPTKGGANGAAGNGSYNGASHSAAPVSFLVAGHRPFEGKIALVTGSGRGLGRTMANQLADLGARVIVNSFFSRERGERVTEEIRARGGDAIHLWGSVANPKQLTGLFEEIGNHYGGLDFFVQNASNGLIAPLDQITDSHWEKAFRTNVVALHQGALLAAPLMKQRGGGKIITLSSPGAHNHIEHFGCIGPVKAAVESLVVYLSVELGPHNIQVNALSAGPLYGELMDSYPDSERLVRHWEARAPDHRLGDEREISNTVMFLLSDLAQKISGAVLLVDGASSRRL